MAEPLIFLQKYFETPIDHKSHEERDPEDGNCCHGKAHREHVQSTQTVRPKMFRPSVQTFISDVSGHFQGHTELQISPSRAKNVEEAAGDIRFCVFPKKIRGNAENTDFFVENFEKFRKCPNASERIQMHPNASERIRMYPNR